MPGSLKTNTRIKTMRGQQVAVLRYIGGGGQGDVYEVLYDGMHKALKWYHHDAIKRPKEFITNLQRNIYNGSPTEEFLWPIDMTDFHEGTFGYVMDLRPPDYAQVNEFLLNHVAFGSYRRAVDACLGIVSAFRVLHGLGYAYQDINTKNFFINPSNGKVLICDNDNVVPDDPKAPPSGIMGTWGFMAPEIMQGSKPNALSDLHSMAVLLFLLLFKVHPLEGQATMGSVLDDRERMRIYATDSLFIFDAEDHSNALTDEEYLDTVALWEQMPIYLKNLFRRAFCCEALHDPNRRPIDVEWTRALARFRSEIQPCPCGAGELIVSNGQPATCEVCGQTLAPELMLELRTPAGQELLPARYDTRIFACQTRATSTAHALDLEGWVIADRANPRNLGLSNMSGQAWNVTGHGMPARQVGPRGVVPLMPGLTISGRGYSINVIRASAGTR